MNGKVNGKIEFGSNWVKVKGKVFYPTSYAVKVLKLWYDDKTLNDPDAPAEFVEETLEYLAKAFSLLMPKTCGEASKFLAILENAYVFTDYSIKDVIDRIYANVNER